MRRSTSLKPTGFHLRRGYGGQVSRGQALVIGLISIGDSPLNTSELGYEVGGRGGIHTHEVRATIPTVRWWLAIALMGVSTACGDSSSPTGPTNPDRLQLQAGAYSLSFSGADAVGGGAAGPIQPGCPGLAASGIRGDVFTPMRLAPEVRTG